MSTKGHFIYEDGIEGYEETSEPRMVLGQFIGFTAYLIIDAKILKSFTVKRDHIYIEVQNTTHLPPKMAIRLDALIDAEVDSEGLLITLKGGHHVTNEIVNRQWPVELDVIK